MRRSLSAGVCALGLVGFQDGLVTAINIPFRRVHTAPPRQRKVPNSVLAASAGDPAFGFSNLYDNVYVADVLVQNQNFTVQLDTGSSDFWVDSSLSSNDTTLVGATTTGFNSTTCYLDTTCASGPVLVVDVGFGNFTIAGQAIVDAIGTNATYGGIMSGLIGLGPPGGSASNIVSSLSGNSSINSAPFPNNLFDSYPDLENYMTSLLSRSESGITDGGIFTIGEAASEWDDVLDTPQLPVLLSDSWSAAVDGLIVNGRLLTDMGTVLPGNVSRLLTLFDTGTARAQAPPDIVDAIYHDLPGAEFSEEEYTLPCDTMLNISIVVGGSVYPIHPIDTVIIPEQGEQSRADHDNTICVSAFSYSDGNYVDMILGDTFLRNVYAVYNFGNWTRPEDGPPYIQLLSTTNASAAWEEFDSLNDARLAARQSAQAAPMGKTNQAPQPAPATISTYRRSVLILLVICLLSS